MIVKSFKKREENILKMKGEFLSSLRLYPKSKENEGDSIDFELSLTLNTNRGMGGLGLLS